MKLYRFDVDVAVPRTDFGSQGFRLARIARTDSGLSVVCIYLGENGVLARHQAAQNQLLMVVEGEGEVSGDDGNQMPIRTGMAAFWERDEWHETTTETGLTAIIIEGESLDPAEMMTEMSLN